MPFNFIVFLVQVAVGIGASYISKKLSEKAEEKARKKAKKKAAEEAAENSGSILEIQYGEGQPRVVAIGKVATAGQLVYDNSFGEANIYLQRVFKVSDWTITGLSRVAIDNEWVTLGSYTSDLGYAIASGDYAGLIWVKPVLGGVTADITLTANDNPDGRWTADHKGLYCAYMIVTLQYDDEKLNSLPEILFEIQGSPLYDFRLDSSVGGSGSHRWNNPNTWAYSENPIVAEYNYRMGFYTGTYGSGHDTFCGMGMAQSDLSYSRYAAAANICDETVEGEARYRVSTFLSADREHGDNIEDLMLSCAGMVVEGVTGPFPILGASQTPVATLTNDDLIADQPVEFRLHRPVSEVVNTVSGVYSEPNLVYAETGYTEQQLAAAVTLDRRTIDYNLNLPMVPSKRQAEQLASIYLSENRYEATKTVFVHPKWLVLEVGDWITWEDDEDGAASRDYQIVGLGIASLGSDMPRIVQLKLQERDDSIYDGIGPVSAPTAATRPGEPSYLQELASFTLTPIYVVADDGRQVPAISVSWAAVTDVTVDAILIEWRPTGDDTRRVTKVVNRNATVAILQEGVVGSTVYQVRNTIIPRPTRVTTPSAWTSVTTNATAGVEFDWLDESVIELMELYRNDINRIQQRSSQLPAGITEAIIGTAQETLFRRTLKAQINEVSAAVTVEQEARVSVDSALAAQLTLVEATADAGTASGLVKFEATSAPSGVTARFGTYLRVSDESNYIATAAEFLEIVGGVPRKVIAADKTVIANSAGTVFALFDSTGTYLSNARIINLTADNIAAGAITTTQLAAGAITADKIAAGTITANQIVAGGISAVYTAAYEQPEGSGVVWRNGDLPVWIPASVVFNTGLPSNVIIMCTVTARNRTSGDIPLIQLYRNGFPLSPQSRVPSALVTPSNALNGTTSGTGVIVYTDTVPAGSYYYQVYVNSFGGEVEARTVYINTLVVYR